MKKDILYYLLFSLFITCFGEAANYKGHKVLLITPESEAHVEFLRKLRDHYSVDLWNEPHNSGRPVLTHVNPDLVEPLQRTLSELKIHHRILHDDLQDLINQEKISNLLLNVNYPEGFNFGIYHPYEEVISLIAELTTKYPKLVKIEKIGKSYESRPIYSLKITNGNYRNKTAIIIECGIHAREWASVAVCSYLVNQLIEDNNSGHEVQMLLDNYEINVVLVSNPDGYVYTWTKDRMWRKSRSRSSYDRLGVCRGADLNRNFDWDHCGIGSNRDPCQNTFCGDKSFSERETQAIRDLMISRKGRTKAYFSIHSYSQLWMTPYGNKEDLPPNYSEMERVGKIGVEALGKLYNTKYKFGTISRTLYSTSGDSIDYAYAKQHIDYAYSLELRDTGMYGFFLPQKEVIPTCKETYQGLVAAIKAMNI